MTEQLFAVVDAKVAFGGVRALDGVSLEIARGDLLGLVGPNGSGKSTLIAAASRLLTLDSGSVWFGGEDATRLPAEELARRGLGRTFQTVRMLPGLTVLENVMLGGDHRHFGANLWSSWLLPVRVGRRERQARTAALTSLDRLGLTSVADQLPGALSYGTQRRVEIARALASEPKLLFLDEPTAGMNRRERDEIGQTLVDLQGQGLTQVLVEHDVKMITDVSSRMVVLNQGRVIAAGSPHECVRLPQVQAAYLGRRHVTA